jgi:mannose-6-phosphate isomerase-like protein (cupin superfamily)
VKIVSLADLPEGHVSHDPEIKKKVMLKKGDLSHVTGFSQAYFAPGQSASSHAHEDMAEVFLVESGTGTIYVNGQGYPLGLGVCVVVDAGEVHEVLNTGSTELVLTYFGVQ